MALGRLSWRMVLIAIWLVGAGCSSATGHHSHAATMRPKQRTTAARATEHPPSRSTVTERAAMRRTSTHDLRRAAAVPLTGERGVIFTVHNQTTAGCVLSGYAHIQLLSAAGRRLPFHYTRGGGPYVTSAAPRPVSLSPAGQAYLLVAKDQCDLGYRTAAGAARWTATRVVIRLPGQPTSHTVPAAFPAGAYPIAFCPRPGDWHADRVAVSPIEATVASLVGR